jgi:hypothetical protein
MKDPRIGLEQQARICPLTRKRCKGNKEKGVEMGKWGGGLSGDISKKARPKKPDKLYLKHKTPKLRMRAGM